MDWVELYRVAMLEHDPRKVMSQLVAAKGAILVELDRLDQSVVERKALEEALNNINVLFEEGAA